MAKVDVPHDDAGKRLDQWLSQTVPGPSRARWQQLIRRGHVAVDGATRKASAVLHGGESVTYEIPPAEPVSLEPEPIALDVIYEDHHFIVINKPPGLVVHPAPGHARGTLVHALLHHCGDLRGVGGDLRPGIVHRLDKDTSGAIVAAKHDDAMQHLVAQFKGRTVEKLYRAVVWGHPVPAEASIDAPIVRSSLNRKKMCIDPPRGKQAISHYAVECRLLAASLVRIRIETGRTHQIRVHMAHIGHPVAGDRLYGRSRPCPEPAPRRQLLHAARLALTHPVTGRRMGFECPLPEDMREVVEKWK